jgi:ArsR family transcriptional regulator
MAPVKFLLDNRLISLYNFILFIIDQSWRAAKWMVIIRNSRAFSGRAGGKMVNLTHVADMFKLVGEKTRFRIIHLLIKRGELCVQTLQQSLRQPQAKISRHLFVLRSAGFVQARRRKQMIMYSLPRQMSEQQRMLMNCLNDHYSNLPELQADLRFFDHLDHQGVLCCREHELEEP